MRMVPIYLERAGKSAALNIAVENAHGELLVFTDDDVDFCATWLVKLWRASGAYRKAAGFCGPIKPIYPVSAPLWIRQHPFRVPGFAEFVPSLSEPQLCPFLPFGPNFAIRAKLSRGMLFRTDLGASETNGPISCEDTEFAARFRENVGPFWFIPDASVGHRVRTEQLSIAWLVERAFLLGRSLIAQALPKELCHPPVWHVGWHPLVWSAFDRSLIINFLLGQLYEVQRYGPDGKNVISEISKLLSDLLLHGCRPIVAGSAQGALASPRFRQVTSLLMDSEEERLL